MKELPYHHDWKIAFETDLGLRVHWFGRYAGYPEWFIPTSRQAADMVDFFFVERHACWAIVNGRKITLNQGDLLVISGADEFSFGHDPRQPHVSLSAALALRQGSVTNLLLQRKFQRRYTLADPRGYVAEFEKVLAVMAGRSPFQDLAVAGALLHWLAYVLSVLRPPLSPEHTEERSAVDHVLAAESWAAKRISRAITLAEWARATGLHPVYFGRIFKRETGLRPMEWLNHRRLQQACQHLSQTPKTVAEIAEACGFASPFYFSRLFRHQFGQSPLQFRKAQHLKA